MKTRNSVDPAEERDGRLSNAVFVQREKVGFLLSERQDLQLELEKLVIKQDYILRGLYIQEADLKLRKAKAEAKIALKEQNPGLDRNGIDQLMKGKFAVQELERKDLDARLKKSAQMCEYEQNEEPGFDMGFAKIGLEMMRQTSIVSKMIVKYFHPDILSRMNGVLTGEQIGQIQGIYSNFLVLRDMHEKIKAVINPVRILVVKAEIELVLGTTIEDFVRDKLEIRGKESAVLEEKQYLEAVAIRLETEIGVLVDRINEVQRFFAKQESVKRNIAQALELLEAEVKSKEAQYESLFARRA